MQVIYHGHSCIEIQMVDSSILIDPWIVENPRASVSIEAIVQKNISHVILTASDPTHRGDIHTLLHHTACSIVTTQAVAYGLRDLALPSDRLIVVADSYETATVCIQFYPLHNKQSNHSIFYYESVLLSLGDYSIYHAGAMSTPQQVYSELWRIDLAFIPIGGGSVMDIWQAVQAIGILKPNIVVPCYYNTSSTLKADDIEFARQVMLAQYSIPKVLRSGQYIVV